MKQKNVLCYGDSNTWGYIPGGEGRFDLNVRWTGVLQNRLGADYRVIEEGLCGRTTVWDDPIEEYKSGLKQLVPIVLSHSPLDLIILMLGTNDLKGRFSVSALDIALSIGTLVNRLNENLASYYKIPKILVVTPPPVVDVDKTYIADMFTGAQEKSDKLSCEIIKYCTENKLEYLDLGKHVVSSPIDGIHLDEKSHAILGEIVSEHVDKMLM